MAHGLGVKHTLDGQQTVRKALQEQHLAIEEAKADIVALYLIATLQEMGALADADPEGSAAVFLTDVFRRGLRGLSDVYARQWLASFSFLNEHGAVTRDPASGTYRVDQPRMRESVAALAARLLTLQGDGDRDGAAALLATAESAHTSLWPDLERLAAADIPRASVFRQGMDVVAGTASARA